jgi:glycosyltransferase involved in cell wall biosynthesis
MHPPPSPSAPIRVLFVLTSYVGGGAERSLLELILRLPRDRVVARIGVLDPTGPLRQEYAKLGLPRSELGAGRGLARLFGARIVAETLRFRPHIVHSRLLLANLWGRLGALGGARVLCEERSLTLDRPPLFTLANRLSMGLCDVLVANSQSVADHVRTRDGVSEDKLRVIPGGVDPLRFKPSNAEPTFDLVSITRLERAKGVIDLIAAMRLVVAQRPATRLLLVGDGSERQTVRQALRDHQLEGAVELAGWRDKSELELPRGRVFVLASHEEGMPNVVLEAMACGLPVVATAVGGTVEVVASGTTGTLIPPREPGRLAQALLAYLDDPGRAQAHGLAGRQRVIDHFTIHKTVEAYLRLYRELAAPRGTR